ncbi:hypothetical protein LAZ67_11001492 [Cordylochernes scorpioides]|uniref:Uncharacterized protein n=1 Tax=Cordylochernes scorpioides TaxID=51811 RepID=A0ABY6KZ73_9ARAC|nr:hypothetical protein LAZ67_11001492 [Cordylochernes scorpioides]
MNFAATRLMPKSLIKIEWHEPIDMFVSSETSLTCSGVRHALRRSHLLGLLRTFCTTDKRFFGPRARCATSVNVDESGLTPLVFGKVMMTVLDTATTLHASPEKRGMVLSDPMKIPVEQRKGYLGILKVLENSSKHLEVDSFISESLKVNRLMIVITGSVIIIVERAIQTLKYLLRKIDKGDWSTRLARPLCIEYIPAGGADDSSGWQ